MDSITSEFAAFPVENAYRHKLRADGRESLAHMLLFPEQGIAGFIYPSVRATGPAKARTYLFGPGLPEAVAEEVMDQDTIPSGYRYYVRRYFDLISPR